MVALRSKEFVGKAEGIKSHELSVQSLIESLKGTLSKLGNQKSSIESRISALYAELAAAENDTDEDGKPDYSLIASIENRIDQANDELDDTEQEISETSGELEKAEREFEQVEEEKQQTLFEIQQRARTTSQNLLSANSMYGAYADVGVSLNRSFQASFDALAQAAAILDGSVGSAGGSASTGGATNTHSVSGVGIGGAIGATTAIAGASHIVSSGKSSNFHSSQLSAVHHSGGKLRSFNRVNNEAAKGVTFRSTQVPLGKTNKSTSTLTKTQISSKALGTTQTEHTGSAYATSTFNKMGSSTKKTTSEQISHNMSTGKSAISGVIQPSNGHFSMNTLRTMDEIRAQMNEQQKAYFDKQISAGGGVSGQRARLQGAGKEFYLTSSSEKKASGNFLTQNHPGVTAQQRKENLQLPYGNDASVIDKVRSVKAAVVLTSQIAAQEEWAEQSGYTARTGMKQVFTPNLNTNGAIADEIYEIVENIESGNPNENKVYAKKIESESIEKSPVVRESFSEKLKNEYHSSINQKIAAANSVSELMNIIKTEQLARNCYLGDLDLPTAKALVQTIYSSIKESGLQDIIGTMPVIGTTSAVFGEIRKSLEIEFQKLYQERYPNEPISAFNEDIQYQVNDYMSTKFGISDNTLAISVSFDAQKDFDAREEKILQGGNVTAAVGDNTVSKSFNGILLNATDITSLKKLKTKLIQGEADGYSPKECSTFQYLAIHELVHQADHILKLSSDPEIIKYYNKFSECEIEKQKELLCLYGADNINEFVAEAYAEAICSAHPRKIALYIKQKFDTAAANYRKLSDDYVQEKER